MPYFLTNDEQRVAMSRGDRLCIERRRRGETQAQAARRWGVSYQLYSSWERDSAPRPGPAVELGRVMPHERCVIYRRHAFRTQAQVAEDIGCCVYTVRKMEAGDAACDDLLGYWES